MRTHVSVEEQSIHTPGEGFSPLVQEVVARSLRQVATVLLFDMFDVGGVFAFNVVDPCRADSNYATKKVVRIYNTKLRK